MRHPIPQGTRDVLPEEMAELRRMERALAELFADRGYGEVSTPALEFAAVLAEGGPGMLASAHRFFDRSGEQLALRTDMTVPIARLVADRFGDREGPFRLFYLGDAYRAEGARGQVREFRQAGVELIGSAGAPATAELIELLVAALDAIGLPEAVVGLGDADLFALVLSGLALSEEARGRILERLAAHDLLAVEGEARAAASAGSIAAGERDLIVSLASMRGGGEVLDRARGLGGETVAEAIAQLSEIWDEIERRGVAARVQLDLGLLRDLGYYTGAILEVYDPALGDVIGGGGRYDGLMGRFGRPLPAAGFALYLERAHVAQAAEQGEGEAG